MARLSRYTAAIRLGIRGKTNLRPWGYESQRSTRTSFIQRKRPLNSGVAVGKDALMCLMRYGFPYESRQNLGKTFDDL